MPAAETERSRVPATASREAPSRPTRGLPAGLSPRLPPLCGGLRGSPRQRLAGVPYRRLSPRRSPRRGPRCQLAPAPSPLGILAPALEREGTECRTLGPWKLPHTDESPQGR